MHHHCVQESLNSLEHVGENTDTSQLICVLCPYQQQKAFEQLKHRSSGKYVLTMINLGYPDIGSLRGPVRTKTRKQENEASIRKIKIKIKTHLLICKLMSKDKNMKITS